MSFRPATLLARLQPLGRALMLPIAVLPIAALLLRLGQPDMLAIPFIAAAGDAIFSNLGLLFAAGVAVGLARENHGAASLAGVIAYLVTTEGAKVLLVLPPDVAEAAQAAWRAKEIAKVSVPAGILSGIVAGLLYNRFSDIKLPDYLAFFAGRRFVPIVAGLAGLFGALMFGVGFPWIEAGIDRLSQWVVAAGPLGLFVYGLLNRLLLITGLHHIINNVAWFLLGDFHGATGDIKRFFAGDPTAGGFMSGFFPVMMFGLPAACLAMYRTALPDRRKRVGGLLLSLALTSFLTGVTEPIEFSFIFLAPILYVVHAVLTGLSMVVMDALGVKLGFGFSAGLFDYLMNYGLATKPLMLIPVGLVYFAVYYATFSWCIRRFNLKTPGREDEPAAAAGDVPSMAGARGPAMVAALGGKANVRSVDACTTRLRLVLGDSATVDEARLRALGARGIVRLRDGGFQVVLGPIADQVAAEIRSALAGHDPAPIAGTSDLVALLKRAGVRAVEPRGMRLLVRVDRLAAVDAAALQGAGVKAWVLPASADGWLHLILGDQAEPLADALRAA
ncbi:PTS N-acetyl-D-glucosamine transporter [Sphingobium sp. PAMC28499]|jgi:PTS system N-acetylglucosamine-specific IIC component|uniref:N-acetylglucosamine-specific PTS transporter subunit IIBC n=1 Tax=Sphingobium sp. PAMC28499 TaxID=2565554 RepID=UPI00109DC54D|nr:N-acetylglucosamine-specific PTS transporter subunit IIBC [Sphingobium sp. PAMC28499]QCB38871.1 PTS N-acetyl-D-glucosamine transporter [Sphingobium sp. PAMC28499]